jgi:hypothetical protein
VKPTKAETLVKVVKPATAFGKASHSRDTIYIKNVSSRDVNSRRTARICRKVSNSREIRNVQHGQWTPYAMPDTRDARNSMEATSQQPMSFRGIR